MPIAQSQRHEHRIEVRRGGENLLLRLVLWIHLDTLHNLQAVRVIGLPDPKRAATRLAQVPHDPADAHRAMQQLLHLPRPERRIGSLRQGVHQARKGASDPSLGFETRLRSRSGFQGRQATLDFGLQLDQGTAQHLNPVFRRRLPSRMAHVIDVLHENEIAIQIVQVVQQRPVASRPEYQAAVVVTERQTVFVQRQQIGRRFLLTESHVRIDGQFVANHRDQSREQFLEPRLMLGRHREVGTTALATPRETSCPLPQMLFEGRTRGLAVAVEFEQRFGQIVVAQSSGTQQQIQQNRMLAPRSKFRQDVSAATCCGLKAAVEGEVVQLIRQTRQIVFALPRKHPGRRTRRGNELGPASLASRLTVNVNQRGMTILGNLLDSVTNHARTFQSGEMTRLA